MKYKFEWDAYRAGVVAQAIRERLYSISDGTLSVDYTEKKELESILTEITQEASKYQ